MDKDTKRILIGIIVIVSIGIISIIISVCSGSGSSRSTPSKSYQKVQDQVIKSDQKWHDNRAKGNW